MAALNEELVLAWRAGSSNALACCGAHWAIELQVLLPLPSLSILNPIATASTEYCSESPYYGCKPSKFLISILMRTAIATNKHERVVIGYRQRHTSDGVHLIGRISASDHWGKTTSSSGRYCKDVYLSVAGGSFLGVKSPGFIAISNGRL
jgi:hypothetical protein